MCSIPDSDNEECDTGRLSSEMAKQAFDGFAQGSSCPISAGNWVIAAQSLILALLIWPVIALIKSDMIVRWKRATSLTCLSLSTILALIAIGVWHQKCVSGFDFDGCTTEVCERANVKGEVSGAYAFECVIMVILMAATICAFIYQFMAGKVNNEAPMMDATPSSDNDAYYHSY